MFHGLKILLEYSYEQSKKNIITITSTHLINYRSRLGNKNEYKLGSLSGFLKKWYKMGFPGMSKDAYDYLNETTFKGNEKGEGRLNNGSL